MPLSTPPPSRNAPFRSLLLVLLLCLTAACPASFLRIGRVRLHPLPNEFSVGSVHHAVHKEAPS